VCFAESGPGWQYAQDSVRAEGDARRLIRRRSCLDMAEVATVEGTFNRNGGVGGMRC
jgi:hypothetical protein